MDLYRVSDGKVTQLEKDAFELEKDIQNLVEENVSELFNLQFVCSEFQLGNFRLDTLCYDEEQRAFVIIEYKRGNSYSVIDQGYSYLSLLLNNKAEFILEYNETQKDSLKKSEVEWENSRIIFVSQSFNTYQKNSVNFKDIPFELWQIKRFSDGLISLDQHFSRSQQSIKTIASNDKQSVISKVSEEIGTLSEQDHIDKMLPETKTLWDVFRAKLEENLDISFDATNSYVGVKKDSSLVCAIEFRKNKITLRIKRGSISASGSKSKGFFTLDDVKQTASETSWTYKSGAQGFGYVISVNRKDAVDYIIFLLKQKFDTL